MATGKPTLLWRGFVRKVRDSPICWENFRCIFSWPQLEALLGRSRSEAAGTATTTTTVTKTTTTSKWTTYSWEGDDALLHNSFFKHDFVRNRSFGAKYFSLRISENLKQRFQNMKSGFLRFNTPLAATRSKSTNNQHRPSWNGRLTSAALRRCAAFQSLSSAPTNGSWFARSEEPSRAAAAAATVAPSPSSLRSRGRAEKKKFLAFDVDVVEARRPPPTFWYLMIITRPSSFGEAEQLAAAAAAALATMKLLEMVFWEDQDTNKTSS